MFTRNIAEYLTVAAYVFRIGIRPYVFPETSKSPQAVISPPAGFLLFLFHSGFANR